MLIATRDFFHAICTHHRLPVASRSADIAGRLSLMADPQHQERFRITDLTRRLIERFINRARG